MRKPLVVACVVLGLGLVGGALLSVKPRWKPRGGPLGSARPELPPAPVEPAQPERTRTVTLRHDDANREVVGEFDTTIADDQFVSVEGLAEFPFGQGSASWGRVDISRDPSGDVGHSTRHDPAGTTYNLTVRFYDASQRLTATFTPPAVTKP